MSPIIVTDWNGIQTTDGYWFQTLVQQLLGEICPGVTVTNVAVCTFAEKEV